MSRAPLEEGLFGHVLRYLLDDFAGRQGLELLLCILFTEAAVHSVGAANNTESDAEEEDPNESHLEGTTQEAAGQGDEAVAGSEQPGSVSTSRAEGPYGSRYETLLMETLHGLRYV